MYRSELLLRDGVCGGGNAGEPYKTVRPARRKVGAGNRDAGRRRFGCGPQAAARPPRHQPSNIMVSIEEGSSVAAKIIDLGLAKPAPDAPAEAAISTPGAFAGKPEFASPEQFADVGVDIRSDLYSLGVVLWEMVTGHVVFRGSPAEVMYQHQHAPLPLDLLEAVSQPVVRST
jgi:serine/threonine protein kinase